MSGKSIWQDATSVTLTVYTNTNSDFSAAGSQLWTGQLALGGSVSFPDQAGWSGATLTLAVDASGVVSLSSSLDPSGGSGRKFLVMVSPAGIGLTNCQWSQMQTGSFARFAALYVDDVDLPSNDIGWTDPQAVPPYITHALGFGGGWNGA